MSERPAKTLGMLDSFIRNQTTYLQGSIVHADQKATFLLTVTGLLIGYLNSKKALGERAVAIFPWNGWESLTDCVLLGSAISLIGAACCAAFAVCPRSSKKAAGESASFREIAKTYDSPDSFANKMAAFDDSDVVAMQLRLHYGRCRICHQKWTVLGYAYLCVAAGGFFYASYIAISMLHGL